MSNTKTKHQQRAAIITCVTGWRDSEGRPVIDVVDKEESVKVNSREDILLLLEMTEHLIQHAQQMKTEVQHVLSSVEADERDKAELLAMAKRGAPKPPPNSRLGRQLKRFTTPD